MNNIVRSAVAIEHESRAAWLAFACICVLTVGVYFPGLKGPFVFDDFNNIVANKALFGVTESGGIVQALLAGNAGPLKRPLSMLSFALNHAATGLDPYYFKLTNLAIHIVNGLLVFLVCRLLLKTDHSGRQNWRWMALGASAIWLLHPMQLTSVLYVVQRMTSLCATFVLLGTLVYLFARLRMLSGCRYKLLLWLVVPALGGAAILAKENGALLFPLLLVVEWTLFRFEVRSASDRTTLRAFFSVFVALPVASITAFIALNPEWVNKPVLARPFTVVERLMTESRVLVLYVGLLFVPAISKLALFYDDFPVSRSLFEPATTMAAIGLIVACTASAMLLRRRFPWWSFAVLWFLVGHSMESTFIMLELIHPHRNYLAYLGPMLACVVGLVKVLGGLRPALSAAAVLAVVAMLAGTTFLRAYQWQNPILLAAYEVHHRPDSARAHYEYGRLAYIANEKIPDSKHFDLAYEHLTRSSELNPQGFAASIALVLLTTDAEHRPDSDTLRALNERLARNMLPPSELIHLRTMVNCRGKDRCAQRPETIVSVFGAALSNSRQTPRIRADLLTLLGMYYANSLGDLPACVNLLGEAVTLMPEDPQRELSLAHALIMSGKFELAAAALNEAERKDPVGRLRFRIEEYRRDIGEMSRRDAGQSAPKELQG